MSPRQLASVLEAAQAVLFDFDGPICSVFAGYPAPVVARELREHMGLQGVELPPTDDPLEVLRSSISWGEHVVAEVEQLLVTAETVAIRSAAPTRGGEASIRACLASGRRAAVVSNNSAAAVVAYLAQHGISPPTGDLVVGRHYGRPHLMKPHPAPIRSALAALGVGPDAAVFVGDTTTDIEAAAAADVACIGYANRPAKHEQLAGAAAVIDDMRVLADALVAVPPRQIAG